MSTDLQERMLMRFWGVRGSHPTPLTPKDIRDKIAAVVQRIRKSDLEDQDSRERFLAGLPDFIFSTPGGNTPCIEVRPDNRTLFIFDAGTGIVELGKLLRKEGIPGMEVHLFFSHFHYDHVQGLPFFGPAYNPNVKVHFYSPEPDLEYILRDQMKHPYFPVTMEGNMSPQMYFHKMPLDVTVNFPGGITVNAHKLRHPGRAYAYKIQRRNKNLIIATDYEILESDFNPDDDTRRFFDGADIMVLDTMYTLGEAIEKINWGHSSFSIGIEFAYMFNIKKLFLFHHEPQKSDKQIYANLQAARWFGERLGSGRMQIELSEEGKMVYL